jgi:putative tryptophan/tyrosine transport system substrate-binding protein
VRNSHQKFHASVSSSQARPHPSRFALAKAFKEGLRDLGYAEGITVAIELRWGQDSVQHLPDLAAELVRLNVDVTVTGGTPAAKALKSATRAIPSS